MGVAQSRFSNNVVLPFSDPFLEQEREDCVAEGCAHFIGQSDRWAPCAASVLEGRQADSGLAAGRSSGLDAHNFESHVSDPDFDVDEGEHRLAVDRSCIILVRSVSCPGAVAVASTTALDSR